MHFSSLHDGLVRYVSRLLRPVWYKPMVQVQLPKKGKNGASVGPGKVYIQVEGKVRTARAKRVQKELAAAAPSDLLRLCERAGGISGRAQRRAHKRRSCGSAPWTEVCPRRRAPDASSNPVSSGCGR